MITKKKKIKCNNPQNKVKMRIRFSPFKKGLPTKKSLNEN